MFQADTLKMLSEYIPIETATERSRTKLFDERLIDVLLEDGTILDKTMLKERKLTKKHMFSKLLMKE